VENIVAGSVRRSPGTIRVGAQLIGGDDGLERWSETFDRPAGDVLAIQSEIAENVARALSIELGGADRTALTLGGTRNAEARDLVLRSIEARRDDSEPSLRRALSLVDQAIALDPNYAEAQARRALILIYLGSVHAASAEQARQEAQLALRSARRAIAIAPKFAMGHAALSNIFRDRLQMSQALREAEVANGLRGTDSPTLNNYAYLLMQAGRTREAQAMAKRIMGLDPLNPNSFEVQTVTAYYARRYQEALGPGRRGMQMAPDRLRIRAFVGNALLQLGRPDDAAREFAGMPAGDYRRITGQAVIAARSGRRSAAHALREELQDRYGDAAHWQYGQIYAQLGMADEAFKDLDSAWEVRDPGLGYVRVDPFIDPLRKDPRLAVVEARLDFPPG
jgi:tetratricopeptide (TPR) repeat protein